MCKKLSIALIFSIFIINIPSQVESMEKSIPSSEQKLSIENKLNVDAPSDLVVDIATIISQGIDPSTITVVLDVDGTLTNHYDPTGYTEKTPIFSRGDAIKTVNWMFAHNINVIFSSAWNKLQETISRLNKLGFGQYVAGDINSEIKSFKGKELNVMSSGHAVSVQDRNADPYYYRQKAFAAYFFDEELAEKTHYLLFADDSSENTRTFQRDIQQHKIYPNLQKIYLYALSDMYGVSDKWEEAKAKIDEILKEEMKE